MTLGNGLNGTEYHNRVQEIRGFVIKEIKGLVL
jgi:hypothetical protein